MDLSGLSVSELEAMLARVAGKAENSSDTSHEDPPTPPPGKPKEANTLYIAPLLWQQIMSYQRKLQRAFDKGISTLSDAVDSSGSPEERGRQELLKMEMALLGIAPAFYGRAYTTGADFAAKFLGGSQLTEKQTAKNIQILVAKNEGFVKESLIPAVAEKYKAIVTSDLTTAAAMDAVDAIAESMGARVGMYALQLWGAGHSGFADEMKAGDQLMEWVVTSGNPCHDCPRLEEGSPYGPDNPLPTFPGAGDTECLSNCLCLLRVWGGGKAARGPGAGLSGLLHLTGGPHEREAADKTLAALQHANGIALEQVKLGKATVGALEALGRGLLAQAEAVRALHARPIRVTVAAPTIVPVPLDIHVRAPSKSTGKVTRDKDGLATGIEETHEGSVPVDHASVMPSKAGEPIKIIVPPPVKTTKRLKKDRAGSIETVITRHVYSE